MTAARKPVIKTTASRGAQTSKTNAASKSRFTKKTAPQSARPTAASTSTKNNTAFSFPTSPFTSISDASPEWLKNSQDMVQQFFDPSSHLAEWQKKLSSISGHSDSEFGKNMDRVSHSISEAMNIGTESVQIAAEGSSTLADMSRQFSERLTQLANDQFTQQIEFSKALLKCRNINEIIDLHSKAAHQAMEKLFEESSHLSEMIFKTAADISEPLQQRANQTAERLSKNFK